MVTAMDRPVRSDRPLSIVVLSGGWSAEREVSLASGRAVTEALRSRGHDVREVDPAEIDVPTYPWNGVDVAFIALHGTFGEDGTVQSLLDDLGVPYTGSGPEASRLAMSKSAAKLRFTAAGLPTPTYHTIHVMDAADVAAAKANELGYPLVVKPNGQGSSIGVAIAGDSTQLADALAASFRHDPLAILEKYIAGRELTVTIIDRRPLPIIEVRAARPFFDYEAKYHDDSTTYAFEIDVPADAIRQVEATAVAAAESLGTSGVVRVDLRLDADGRPWLLEINTIPGFTDHSLVPKAAAHAGINFAELCDQLARAKVASPTNRVGVAA
jgi:D-alanine-D-alanine ligase